MADLCVLADVKAWLQIASGITTDDTLLARLITAISLEFMREIHRTDIYPAANYTETREGDGDVRLTLRHWPLNSVASLTIAGASISQSLNQIADGWYFDADLDDERRYEVYLAGSLTYTDGSPVVITYNAGYAAIPDDINQAVIEWVCYRYKTRQWIGTPSAHTQGESVTNQIVTMPPTTQAVIERYRKTYPGLDQQTDTSQNKGSRGSILTPRMVQG